MVAQCKPLTKDHLPLKTAFAGTKGKGWSLVPGFTVLPCTFIGKCWAQNTFRLTKYPVSCHTSLKCVKRVPALSPVSVDCMHWLLSAISLGAVKYASQGSIFWPVYASQIWHLVRLSRSLVVQGKWSLFRSRFFAELPVHG